VDLGSDVESFKSGDQVAYGGSGDIHQAELVAVPVNLVTRVPDGVSLADAATVTLGAIALQGVRRAQAVVGERVGVIGLGILGQLTVQLLKATGCKVFGTDSSPMRVAQAKALGLDMAPTGDAIPVDAALQFSEGYGLDAVLVTTDTNRDEPLHLAMQMARRKGRVVMVGEVGLAAQRDLIYEKELDLFISTFYGPGRYDPSYEAAGLDYPYAYVRWTENRNMQAYLELIAAGQITLEPLTAQRLPLTKAAEAYHLLQEESLRPYTILLEYPTDTPIDVSHPVVRGRRGPVQDGTIRLAILGAGSLARGVHLPNLRNLKERFRIEGIVTQDGQTATAIARQTQARIATTDYQEVLADRAVDAVLIATRPDLHAEMVAAALRAGKHVLVENPLALTPEELTHLEQLVDELSTVPAGCPTVFVGFNRRYSPYAVRLRERTAKRLAPLHLIYRMNAAYLPPEHWVHGPEGGGRIRGEACHIFDLFHYCVGAPATAVHATGVGVTRRDVVLTDNYTATICYADGSLCTLLHTTQGGEELSKEAMEVHVGQQSYLLDDYRQLRGFGTKLSFRTRRQNKGHYPELIAFQQAIAGTLDRKELWAAAVDATRTTFEVDRQIRRQT
jgi:predicted dehydrogenase